MSEVDGKAEIGRDTVIQSAMMFFAVVGIVAAIWSNSFPQPFPVVELVLTVAAAAATRQFGLALPGKGFASFVQGVVIFALLRHGWAWGALVTILGMPAGDLLLRRLNLRTAFVNAGHLTTGAVVVGFVYQQALDGALGSAAMTPANTGPLLFLLLLEPLLVNATFYLELAASSASIAWVDAQLTMRWEVVVYALSAALALAWLAALATPAGIAWHLGVGVLLVAATALAHWIARTGVKADELILIQRLSSAIAADISLARNFATIQELTRRIVPYEHMGFSRYDAARHEMELIADTTGDLTTSGRARYHADQGLTGEALRRKGPVFSAKWKRGQVALADFEREGSEILIPLLQGDRVVGAWSIRHPNPAMYREVDAQMLHSLAPSLALSLRLHSLVAPLLDSSEQTSQYVEHLTATSQEIHASSEEVTAATQRAETGALAAAQLVDRAEQAMLGLRSSAHDAAAAGEETHRAAQQMETTAQSVRLATAKTALALDRIGETVEQGAAEVSRLREAADQVGHFAETIGAIASQTNMLALNATIEAARAGAHGTGFAVVADEVRRLAEQSAREADQAVRTTSDTRRVIDHAAQLLDRMRRELSEIAMATKGWIAEIEAIVQASEIAANLSNRMIEFPRRNTLQADEMQVMLQDLRKAAQTSASEAQVVAAAAAEQLQAIESLSRSAIQLSTNAEQLSQAARFVRE